MTSLPNWKLATGQNFIKPTTKPFSSTVKRIWWVKVCCFNLYDEFQCSQRQRLMCALWWLRCIPKQVLKASFAKNRAPFGGYWAPFGKIWAPFGRNWALLWDYKACEAIKYKAQFRKCISAATELKTPLIDDTSASQIFNCQQTNKLIIFLVRLVYWLIASIKFMIQCNRQKIELTTDKK